MQVRECVIRYHTICFEATKSHAKSNLRKFQARTDFCRKIKETCRKSTSFGPEYAARTEESAQVGRQLGISRRCPEMQLDMEI